MGGAYWNGGGCVPALKAPPPSAGATGMMKTGPCLGGLKEREIW